MKRLPIIISILAGIFIFLSFYAAVAKNVDPDLYWHLKDGQVILAIHSVPRVDTYSYTMQGFPWVDHEWLVEAGLYFMFEHDLWSFVIFFFSLVAFIPFAIWLARYRSLAHLCVIALFAAVLVGFLGVRPQLISYLFFFGVFELLAAYYVTSGGSRRKEMLYVLPLIFFAWANIHAEFFSGLVLFGIFIVVDTALAFYREETARWREVAFSSGALAASAAAALLNPYGAGLYREVVTVMFSGETARYVAEWMPIFTKPPTIPLAILFISFAFFAVKLRNELSISLLVVSGVFFLLFVKSSRIGPLFLMTAMPIFHGGVGMLEKRFTSAFNAFQSRAVKNVMIGGVVLLAVVMLGFVAYGVSTITPMVFTEGVADFLNQEVAEGFHITIINDYGWGGYLIWNVPAVKDFIDGRMPHWIVADGNSAMKDYVDVFYNDGNPDAWKAVFEKWRINTVLIDNGSLASSDSVLKIAPHAGGWRVVYEDPAATILQNFH